jgi:hypothetical protein
MKIDVYHVIQKRIKVRIAIFNECCLISRLYNREKNSLLPTEIN